MTAVEAYPEVEETLDNVSKWIVRKFGGHYDDVRADANYFFLQALDRYDPVHGPIEKWVRFRVYKNLLEVRSQELQRASKKKAVRLDAIAVKQGTVFNVGEFLDGLTKDGRVVVSLALETPQEVQRALVRYGGDKPHHIRWAVWEVLKQRGWSVKRATVTFKEVKEAL